MTSSGTDQTPYEGTASAGTRDRLPLSVYFITQDEEDRIARSLERVIDWADEVIVVDSGSSDRTCEIAKDLGAQVVRNDWAGYAAQKTFAASQCRNHWVLDLDADEVLSDELVSTIKQLFWDGEPKDCAAYEMGWVMVWPFDSKPRWGMPKKYIIRLYDRRRAAIQAKDEMSNDDRPKVREGRVGRLQGLVHHYTIRSLSDVERKTRLLTDEQAVYFLSRNRRIPLIRIYFEFPLQFLKYFFVRRLFLGGWYGFTVAVMAAYRQFMRLAKWKELASKQSR